MDFKRLADLAKNVPWSQLAEYGPQIAEGLQKLRKVREELEETAREVARAEAGDAARDAVAPLADQLVELATQLESQSRELDRLSTERTELARAVELQEIRLRTAFWMAGGGLAAGLVALVVALVT